jgi:hypothetical protein
MGFIGVLGPSDADDDRILLTTRYGSGYDGMVVVVFRKKNECVGTHKDCTYFDNVPKVLVPTIKGKDTGTVSLGATAGREPGGRRATYPCSPTKVRRSYASVLKGL